MDAQRERRRKTDLHREYKSMEDESNNTPSREFEPLFIKEDDGEQERAPKEGRRDYNTQTQSGFSFTEAQLRPCSQIQPYLREMDDLLKSCEGLTGIPFGSRLSPGYVDTQLGSQTHVQLKEEVRTDGCRVTSPQPYQPTTYIDTRMDSTGPELGQNHQRDMSSLANRCEGTQQMEIGLTSAGTELSDTMEEYQSQLLGMLAMLESCMGETDMDFDTQECATDANHEYIQISNQSHGTYRTTKTELIESGGTAKSTTTHNSVEVGESCATCEGPGKPMVMYEMGGQEKLRTEIGICVDFKADFLSVEPQLTLSDPQLLTNKSQNEAPNSEGMHTESMCTDEETHSGRGNIAKMDIGDTDFPAGARLKVEIELTHQNPAADEFLALGSQMEKCIEEVGHLESRRDELLEEALELREQKEERRKPEGSTGEKEATDETNDRSGRKVAELMEVLKREEEQRREERKVEVSALRERRSEEERSVWKVNLERQALQDETLRLRRRLFSEARSCAHTQVILANRQCELEQYKAEEERLQSLVLQLAEEGSQLRTTQTEQLSVLWTQLHAQATGQTSNTQEELNQCRRHSCGDIQQYLQGGLKALEDRFEPMLMALLKRRETTAGAMVKAREQAQDLKAQLRPLMEERQKLGLQRVCLEEKLKLMHIQGKEHIEQYKETVFSLEESSRELKTEFRLQKRKTQKTEELKDNLTKQLLVYRAAIEDHMCDLKEKT